MGRLSKVGISVYLLRGNHDAASQITKQLEFPSNVHEFGTRKPETFHLGTLKVALHGQGFRQRDVQDNLTLKYPAPQAGAFNIGVLHTGLGGGRGNHANYAPCSLEDLVHKGYDYWALGHVHQAEVLHERPHIVFPGNLQGRHVRETGPKGACLVTVEEREITNLEFVPCDVVRWAKLLVPLHEAETVGDVIDRVRGALVSAVAREAGGRLLACRIVFEGRTCVHEQLITSEEKVLAEARACALGLGEEVAWVEKIVIATEPDLDSRILTQREDAIGELQRMLRDARNDDELLAQIAQDISTLVRRLPHELRVDVEDEVMTRAIGGDYVMLIDTVAPYLSARLMAPED